MNPDEWEFLSQRNNLNHLFDALKEKWSPSRPQCTSGSITSLSTGNCSGEKQPHLRQRPPTIETSIFISLVSGLLSLDSINYKTLCFFNYLGRCLNDNATYAFNIYNWSNPSVFYPCVACRVLIND